MSGQHSNCCTGLHVPDPESPIMAAAREPSAVGAQRGAIDLGVMTDERLNVSAGFRMPNADIVVRAAGDKQFAVRIEHDGVDLVLVRPVGRIAVAESLALII